MFILELMIQCFILELMIQYSTIELMIQCSILELMIQCSFLKLWYNVPSLNLWHNVLSLNIYNIPSLNIYNIPSLNLWYVSSLNWCYNVPPLKHWLTYQPRSHISISGIDKPNGEPTKSLRVPNYLKESCRDSSLNDKAWDLAMVHLINQRYPRVSWGHFAQWSFSCRMDFLG